MNAPESHSANVSPSSEIRQAFLFATALGLACLALYSTTLRNGFINFDDNIYVYDNPQIRDGFSRQSLAWAFSVHTSNWMPLTWLSYFLDYRLYGLEPWGYHLTNSLLHAANTVWLFFLLRRMTNAPRRSAMVAAIFALHPLHVESVAWVAERKDVLSGFFGLCSLWFYAVWTQKKSALSYTATAAAFALGLMAKPMLVTWPFLMLLLDFWPLQRLRQDPPSEKFRTLLLEKTPFLLMSAVCSYVAYASQTSAGATVALDWPDRLAHALAAYMIYLGKTFWPEQLAIYYPYKTISRLAAFAAGFALILITLGALAARRNRPWLCVGWLWFCGLLIPVIGLVKIGGQAYADRYMYLPLAGLSIAFVWQGAEGLAQRRGASFAAALLCAGILIILAARSFFQIGYWKNSATLFEHAVSAVAENHVGHFKLGETLLNDGDAPRALEHFASAIRYEPDLPRYHDHMGRALVRMGRFGEALPFLNRAITLEAAHWETFLFLADALSGLGRFDEAVKMYERAVAENPDYVPALEKLAETLMELSRFAESEAILKRAVEKNPASWRIRFNLGASVFVQERWREAADHFLQASKLAPLEAIARQQAGEALRRAGDVQAAEKLSAETEKPRPGADKKP